MPTTHKGMRISESDWENFMGHLQATLDHFQVPEKEQGDVRGFILSTKDEIVES